MLMGALAKRAYWVRGKIRIVEVRCGSDADRIWACTPQNRTYRAWGR